MVEIVNEVARHHPDATPEEISNAVVRYIEIAIPEAIRSLTLPKLPSPTHVALERLRLRRRSRIERSVREERTSTYAKFISALYRARYSLDGNETGTSISESQMWNVSTVSVRGTYELDGYPQLGVTPTRFVLPDLDSQRSGPTVEREHPWVPFTPEQPIMRVRKFLYHEDFVEKLTEEQPLEKVAKVLEQNVREFAEQSAFDWNFELFTESDVEIPSWKRFVLQISATISDFDERVRQWDLLDGLLRQRISDLSEKYPEYKNEIRRFAKSFFLRMELA